jgi:hypothetical protein
VTTFRTEQTFASLDAADKALPTEPQTAMTLAEEATKRSPDSAPAWWVRLAAADASGDPAGAGDAAQRLVDLEGFGQQWMNLAILSSRAGAPDPAALAAAIRGPSDPIVELNAAALFFGAGDAEAGDAAVLRLFQVQADVEPILQDAPDAVRDAAATLRSRAADDRVSEGDPQTALLIALSGDDRGLAASLIADVAQTDPASAAWLTRIADAWYGDDAARSAFESDAARSPNRQDFVWLWRLAIHACDRAATDRWEHAIFVGYGYLPSLPTKLLMAPEDQAWMLPTYYPSFIWRLAHPERPYVAGTYSYAMGRPACVTDPAPEG